MDKALTKRVVSGVVMIAVVVADMWVGGWLFALSIAVVVVLMTDEWARLATDLAPRQQFVVRLAATAVAVVAALVTMAIDVSNGVLTLVIGAMLAAGIVGVIGSGGITRAAAGACYVGFPAVALIWLRGEPSDSMMPLLWLFLVVWATDIFAYFVGRGIGGPKLAPSISPGKTWAGLIGGMLGAAIVGGIVSAATGGPMWLGVLVAPLLAVIAQAGDLFESFLKRRAGVKDSGTLIPGHGGALDRLDGLLFAAPVYALLVGFGGRVVG